MKLLKVQEFLETHSFKELQEKHGVYASFSKSGQKFSLNYDQISVVDSDLLSQDCRGLILSCENGNSLLSQTVMVNGKLSYDNIIPGKTKILAFGMKRFFNYGQPQASIDWNDPDLSVQTKMDGTLIFNYYDPFINSWCCATRSVSEADLLMDNGLFTFRTLFEKALFATCGKTFDEFTKGLNKNITYCFELVGPLNQIVVKYSEHKVILLAARRLYGDFDEINMSHLHSNKLTADGICRVNGVPLVHTHAHTCVNDLLKWINTLNPSEQEGVVVCDSKFNRIKIKSDAYVLAHKMRDSLAASPRNIMECILLEKDDDIVPLLPEEIKNNLFKMKDGLKKVIKFYDDNYAKLKSKADSLLPNDKKTFAILITKDKDAWNAPYFEMYDGKVNNMKDFIARNNKNGFSSSLLDKLIKLSENI